MRVSGMVKTSLIDFPERIACVLFTQGCNWDCYYCHNRELIPRVPGIGGPAQIPTEQVLAFLRSRVDLLEGVVISGGEPTLHADLGDFIRSIRTLGFAVKLDTNGSNPSMIQRLLEEDLVDYIALDIKGPWEKYAEICGANADYRAVQKSLRLVRESRIGWELRTTECPSLTQTDLSVCTGYISGG